MSINLRSSAGAGGARNIYDQTVNFSSYGGLPSASGATNVAAVGSFNTALAGFTGRTQLIIDPGTYNFSTGVNFATVKGSKLTISAYGTTLTAPGSSSNGVNIGNNGYNDNLHNAKFTTTSAGQSTITLVTSGQTSLFTSGNWVLVTGIDMQGYGYPQNPGLFEFKQIASIGTGTLTFTEPLINTYKSTWPSYALGDASNLDQGGPANVYVLKPGWDAEIEFKGATFTDTGNLTYGSARQMFWTDCTFNTYGPCPSINLLYRANRCVAAGTGGLEVDKCVHRIEVIDTMFRAVDFQSASINELYVLNMTQSPNPRWRGGAQRSNTFINLNCGTGPFNFGEMNYGAMGPTTMTNCSAATGDWFVQTMPFSDMTEEGGGVLSYAGGPSSASAANTYFFVPDQNCILVDSSNAWARSFQVSDVSQSGGRTYVTTNLPFPVPGTINGKTSPWKIASHPCADLTMVNCSGNSMFTAQSLLPAHTPFNNWTL